MAVIKSGASTDQLTIDATSKAARVTLYQSDGTYGGEKATYRAATTASVVAAAGAAMFFVIAGSATKTVRVRRIRVSGDTLTTLAVNSIVVEKWSTAPTGGTPVTLVQVPNDSNDAAATASLVQVYTAAPTEGTLVGTVACNRHMHKSSTVADGASFSDVEWTFGSVPETRALVLRGTTQALSLAFGAVPASAVTLAVEVEWTEE
jgi:hypothetical protein